MHQLPVCISAQVACGLDHTLAVAQNGQVYAFGDNSLCQLGRAGSMGVQETSADAAAWIVRDKKGADIIFTKVHTYCSHAVSSPVHLCLKDDILWQACIKRNAM